MITLTPPTRHGSLSFHWLGRVAYDEALALQGDLAARRRAGEINDTVLLLEHEPVYTIGRTPDKTSLAPGAASLPHPVVEISRGGQATYHGPGQLVGYPILDLQQLGSDLHTYLRALENAIILTCAGLGLATTARPGLTGVWAETRKLASIGVGVRHWISLHGFALNVTKECLAGFQSIVPCGIAGVEMTCLEREFGRPVSVRDLAEAVQAPLSTALGTLVRA